MNDSVETSLNSDIYSTSMSLGSGIAWRLKPLKPSSPSSHGIHSKHERMAEVLFGVLSRIWLLVKTSMKSYSWARHTLFQATGYSRHTSLWGPSPVTHTFVKQHLLTCLVLYIENKWSVPTPSWYRIKECLPWDTASTGNITLHPHGL